MNLYDDFLYVDDVTYVMNLDLPWDEIKGKSFLISGATGLVGSFLVDVLLSKNIGCTVYAIGRSEGKARTRFSKWDSNPNFVFLSHDVNDALLFDHIDVVDYVLHLASNTHPIQYSTDPIGTISTNIIGLQNMLNFAVKHQTRRFLFISSNEIYGENRGDVELFKEDYCGYINCNTLRAGYPESKRCGEALCQAYRHQEGLDIAIARLTRTYGPTMLSSDTKAISQFIKKALKNEDIVLKSEGTQYYSYIYVADAVSGLLYVLLDGANGEVYNVSDVKSDITLKELASVIANKVGKNVIFELPDAIEAKGYSKATKARLDSEKLKRLGWSAKYNICSGVDRTIDILKNNIS